MGSGSVPQQQHPDDQQHVRANQDELPPSQQGIPPPARPPVVRVPPPEKQDPAVKYAGERPNHEEWGTGEKGYKTPKDASDRMRKNLPYKVQYPSEFLGVLN